MRFKRVLVAGAGLAGLTAAYELGRAGIAVTLIEARDRVGGRVWTVRDAFAGGAFAELGAEFIDDDHRQIRTLIAKLGIETVRVLRHGFTQRYRTDDGGFTVSRTQGWEELREALAPLVRDYKAAGGKSGAARVKELATYSLRDWLRRHDAPQHLHAMADALRGFFLADPEQLSALPVAAELAEGGSPAQTPVHRVIGGNGRLLDALVRNTPARLLLGHRIDSVRHATDRVVCSVTDDRGARQELEGDALVITLPTTALKAIDIAPALPEMQWRAVRSLRYGCATKVVVQTDVPVFGSGPARAFATDAHVGAFWDASEGQPAGACTVSFLAGGSASRRMAERIANGADALLSDVCWLRRRHGRRPTVRATATWTWEQDPLAGGGYAYLDPGFDPAWLPLLRRRAGRLFFAGEHTSDTHQGYMEGAVESAQRVVGEVVA